MAYFEDLAAIENPGKEQIVEFLTQTEAFLNGVVGFDIEGVDLHKDPPPLFTPALQELARTVLEKEIAASFDDLRSVVGGMPGEHREFVAHGLIGAPQHFALKVLGDLEKARSTFRRAWRWIRKMLILLDAVLKSIVDAAKSVAGFGVGAAVLEYKDALISMT